MEIAGHVALATGAGSGLGAATARRLAAAGMKVALLDRDGARAQAVAAECGGLGLAADVTDAAQVEAAFAAVAERFGSAPRLVVNCAGIAPGARVVGRDGALSISQFEMALRINLLGTFIVMSVGAREMTKLAPIGPDGERGVIVNTSSVAYEDGQIGQTAYAASKGGVASLTLPAARELARSGVRVMAIAPGMFETPMASGLPEDVKKGIAATIPFPSRFGYPDEYARLVEHIAGNPMLNGSVIRLDAAVRLPPK